MTPRPTSNPITRRLTPSLLAAAALSLSLSAQTLPQANSRPASQPTQMQANTIGQARSQDGLAFSETAAAVFQDTAVYDLLRLPTDRLLTLMNVDGHLAVSRSQDDGKSWSPPRPLRLTASKNRPVEASAGALVLMPDGSARLYFTFTRGSTTAPGEASEPRRPAELAVAVTRNGLDYELDGESKVPGRLSQDSRLVAVRFGSQVHLYIANAGPRDRQSRDPVEHLTSRDGRRFERAQPVRTPGFDRVTDICVNDKQLRAYLSASDGVRSMTSTDGAEWTPERDLRLSKAADLVTAPLKDHGILALYSSPAAAAARKLPQLAEAPSEEAQPAAQETPPQATEAKMPDNLSDAGDSWEPFTAGSNEPNSPFLDSPDAQRFAQPAAAAQPDWFPPKPDFKTPVDYVAWYKQQNPTDVPDNAYADFQALHEEWENPPGLKPAGWADGGVNDMFNGEYNGPIGPWDPAEHPEWEQTHQALSGFLDRFSLATWHENLAYPLTFSTESTETPALINLLLPSLGENRAYVKAALADAWRMQDGKVSPEIMLDRFGASLRSATLVGQGPTLIHQLVRIAEQNSIEQSARLALEHNVFTTPEQIAAAYSLLASSDFPSGDPAHWLRSEAAMGMDAVQFVFPPAGPNGEAHLDTERAVNFAHMMGALPANQNTLPPEYANLGAEDARKMVDAIDSHNRQLAELWRTGYPQVRQSDVANLDDQFIAANPLLQPLTGAYARSYAMEARAEASRRATQLTYAVHLYKAQTGTWPASLADLPEEFGSTIRTDPFTGGYFGYQLTETGPKIYSLGENGLDNGGIHSRRWGDDHAETGSDSDDFVFFPVQQNK